ncbi:MAG: DUF1674 domain-containing protein [Chromatiales bacterium]|nr:DUF1674 domain-containing protein [Chromatiales bacterium]
MSENHEAKSKLPSEQPEVTDREDKSAASGEQVMPREIGGRSGPEPTRFGDWEKNGRCIDF